MSILPDLATRAAFAPAIAGVDGRVAARVRALQFQAISQSSPSALANLPAIAAFAFIIRNDVSVASLAIWVAAGTAILSALMVFARATKASGDGIKSDLLYVHTSFAAMVGALWGAGGLAFGPYMSESELLIFVVMVFGCNAACISALGVHLPAFFGYCLCSIPPLACVTWLRHEPALRDITYLAPLYVAVIAANAIAYHRQVVTAFRLLAQNERLADDLARANVATAEARRSKWNTLAQLSHELRTPMNAIMGFSQMMHDQIFGPLADRYRDYSGHIHESGHHMLDLIDAILDVSRAETGQLTIEESEFAPGALVEECLAKVRKSAAAKRLTLETRSKTRLPLVLADRAKLRQAVLSLLTNAIKYTHEDGHIAVALAAHGRGLEITVIDSGIGIAPEDIEKCQEPFVRIDSPLIATADGAGLGLPLARRLAEAHGGQFRLASELGQGTTATIRLPAERCVWPDEERKRA